jgi:hypothetical protein
MYRTCSRYTCSKNITKTSSFFASFSSHINFHKFMFLVFKLDTTLPPAPFLSPSGSHTNLSSQHSSSYFPHHVSMHSFRFQSFFFKKTWYIVNCLSVFTQFSYCPSRLFIIFLSSYLPIFNVNFTCFIRYNLCIPIDQIQCPLGLRRGPMAAQLLELHFRIPPWHGLCISCECCVLSGRGLCEGLITRPEEIYRVSDVAE